MAENGEKGINRGLAMTTSNIKMVEHKPNMVMDATPLVANGAEMTMHPWMEAQGNIQQQPRQNRRQLITRLQNNFEHRVHDLMEDENYELIGYLFSQIISQTIQADLEDQIDRM